MMREFFVFLLNDLFHAAITLAIVAAWRLIVL